jgi:TM2 domain-containing membrane protein YozV
MRADAVRLTSPDSLLIDVINYHINYNKFLLNEEVIEERALAGLRDEVLLAKARDLRAAQRAYVELDRQRGWLAGGLSALLPGAGQLYNGRYSDAAVSLGINGALGVGTYYAWRHTESWALRIGVSALLAGFYVGNIVHAVSDAERINDRREATAREQMARELWPRVTFEIDGESVRFGYRFDWPGEGND